MTYQEPDAAVIAAARDKFTLAFQAVESTQSTIAAAEAALKSAQAERQNLISTTARGGSVQPGQHREAEESIREKEAELLRLQEILTLQIHQRKANDEAQRAAHATAHKPVIIHGIRELHAAGVEIEAATAILNKAKARDHAARQAILAGFGAGYPMPSAIAPKPGNIWIGLPLATHDRALRTDYGSLADEALGPVSAPAAD